MRTAAESLQRYSTRLSKMPIHILASAIFDGVSLLPFVIPLVKVLPPLFLIWLLKMYFGGASNNSERLMHSKVVMITVFETHSSFVSVIDNK